MIAQWLDQVVRGPVELETFGRSITIHPMLASSRPGRFPSQAVVVTTAARRLMELSKEGDKIKSIVVLGDDADPSEHPEFHEISEQLREVCNKWFPKGKLCVICRVPSLDRQQTRHALNFYDHPIARLDAGTQKTFAALTGQKPAVFKSVVENLTRLENDRLIVETEFVRGDVDNSKDTEVRAWLRHLADIRPSAVRILTPTKAAAKGGKPITKTRMTEIADLVAEKTGLSVEVVGG
ncbi:MAG: hypothetical protein WD226_12175 [Planctomycetota bacterium]